MIVLRCIPHSGRALTLVFVATLCSIATASEVKLATLVLETASACAAPVSTPIDLKQFSRRKINPAYLRLYELQGDGKSPSPVPIQFEPDARSKGKLWWLLPSSDIQRRQFLLTVATSGTTAPFTVTPDSSRCSFEIAESGQPVLRYNHGVIATPPHIDTRYARGNYIMPLFGLNGEILSDDFPKDHPHHRGVSWAWPVTRLDDEVRDLFAVVGVWARPVRIRRLETGAVFALLEAENVWKWNDDKEMVREEVVIRVFPKTKEGRYIDIELRLTALVDGVAIGGRPGRGYGGFGFRAANSKDRTITCFTDSIDVTPRRAWLDYSGVFSPEGDASGVTIFENVKNPNYPNELHQYGHCNYVMPAYPGKSEVSLSRTKPLVLNHRLWIHQQKLDQQQAAAVWDSYAYLPVVTIFRSEIP